MFVVTIIHLLLLDPIALEPSGGQACLGGFGSFVCSVNGTLVWDLNGNVVFFSIAGSKNPQRLSNTIFTAHFLAIEDGVVSSRITTEPYRVNRSLNGTIKCRNTIPPDGNGTVSESIIINVTGKDFL